MGRITCLLLAIALLSSGCDPSNSWRFTDIITGVSSYQGQIDTGGDAQSVALFGSYAYVYDIGDVYNPQDIPIQIIDISDPTAPAVVGTLALSSYGKVTLKTFVHSNGNTYLVVLYALSSASVSVYSLSDPTAPVNESELTESAVFGATDAKIIGDIAYISGSRFGIVDLADPTTPDVLSRIDLPGDSWDRQLCILDNHAYVTNYSDGLVVIDVGNPNAPDILTSDTQFGNVGDVEVAGDNELLISGDSWDSWVVKTTNTPTLEPGPAHNPFGQFSSPSPQVTNNSGENLAQSSLFCYRTEAVYIIPVYPDLVEMSLLAAPGSTSELENISWLNDMVVGTVGGTTVYAVAYGNMGLVLFAGSLS